MKMSIRVKLIGGFLIVVVMLLAVFGIAYNGLSSMGSAADTIEDEANHADHVMEMLILQGEEWQWYTDYALTHDEGSLVEAQDHGVELEAEAVDLRGLMTTAEAAELDIYMDAHEVWVADIEAMAAVYVSGDWEGGNELMLAVDASGEEMLGLLESMEVVSAASMAAAMESADSAQSSATTMTIVIAIIAALVAVALGFFISRGIANGVGAMLVAANGIAEGDLDQNVNVKSKDEIGEMAVAFTGMIGYMNEMAGAATSLANGDLTVEVTPKSGKDTLGNAFTQMIGNLRGVIGQATNAALNVAEASGQLSNASEQAGQATQGIASTSQQVAKGAEEQSQSVQDTTGSMEQLAKAIDQIAQGAQEQARGIQQASGVVTQVSSASEQVATSSQGAAEGSRNAAEAAQGGADTVNKTIDGMQKIMSAMALASQKVTDLGARSNEIGKIVATIDDIAAQTNLLALNAAIEAARAGEQGRGFAVVADEVRKLAERSSMATKEIADLITGIQSGVGDAVSAMEEGNTEVQAGNELAGEAGEALKSILEASTGVSSQIEQISAAAEELQASSTELVKVIDGVSSVVEESTAATEQMAANSTEVMKSLESVAGISEQNSAATQEISASAEEMSAQVQQVVASSQSMAEMAEELKKAVATFRLNKE